MLNANTLIGSHDILLMTLDTLRYDVAQTCLMQGRIPNLAKLCPTGSWEERHTPGSFTYAAHQAFFAGFLPTPIAPGIHPRLLALAFPGSESIDPSTLVLDAPDIVSGFEQLGYHTICIGGVGFFNKLSPLGCVLPHLFSESHWSPEMGVTDPDSTRHQVDLAVSRLRDLPKSQRIFLFVNISAIHQPNCLFLPGATKDSPLTQAAALEYVDSQLPPLFEALQNRAPALTIICSDHGTAYGENDYTGHRIAHSVVWTVPYLDCILPEVKP